MPDVLELFEQLIAADVSAMDREGLAEVVARSAHVRGWVDAFDVRCARRGRELAAAGSAESPAALLGRCGGRSSKDSSTITDREAVASAMTGFEDSLARGGVSSGHLDAIADATRRLEPAVRADFAVHESELLEHACHEGVDVFTRRCRELARRLSAQRSTSDTDELDRQRRGSQIRRWVDRLDGMHHTHVALDPVRDAKLQAALDHAIGRRRQVDGNARTPWDQLQVDAFVDAVSGGVIVDEVDDDAGRRHPPTASQVAAAATDALDRIVAGATPSGGVIVDRDSGATAVTDALDGDAGPAVVERTLARIDARVPEICIHLDHRTLLEGLHEHSICETADGVPLPVSTVRRLCCDAELIPIVLDGDGRALDVGRSKRTATPDQRRALRAMHRTCIGPDCTVPFSQTRAHHIEWWTRDRGATDIANLAPVCERCHHLVHEGGWTLSMTADRIATWIRPDGSVHHVGPTVDRHRADGEASTRRRVA